jgi:hypothetical protein
MHNCGFELAQGATSFDDSIPIKISTRSLQAPNTAFRIDFLHEIKVPQNNKIASSYRAVWDLPVADVV